MFNPEFALFSKSAHGNTYQPDPKSSVNENHLFFFKFIGRIIGKALLDGQYLECYFTRALYKAIVGQPLTYQDMADTDPELYQSLSWLKENDASALGCTFTYTRDHFGKMMTIELIENGKDIAVTNENKQLFIIKICKKKLYEEIKPQIESLLQGLYELIPKDKLSIFDYREIELMISGLPDVDVIDLKKNTDYSKYTESSQVIIWFWEILESFTQKERAEFLQFVTGSSKVPLDGFRNLPGSSGIQKFSIHNVYKEQDRLPTAHTWYFLFEINLMFIVLISWICLSILPKRLCMTV
jgi:E3 ubiquitin-protein ligase HUWE1